MDPPPFEVLVCGTAEDSVARQVHRHFPDARVGFAPAARPGGGRNDLLPAARGEWLYFLDDDVTVGVLSENSIFVSRGAFVLVNQPTETVVSTDQT